MSEEDPSSDELKLSAEEDEEEEFDERKHASLLRSITALDGKSTPSSERRELISMSEHHAPSAKGHVKIHQLVGALQNKLGHEELKKQIRRVKKKEKVLPVPLSKPEQQRIHRSLAYENTTREISKWDPTVKKNRLAEQIIYPLEKPDIQILSSPDELCKRIQPKTALEKEVAALLGEHQLGPEKILTPAEERTLRAMSIEEAKRRRAELQKYRALLSYKETKARRQNKIKSKKYHRILRKERLKKEKKALEELQKTDPDAFLEKLKELDAKRIEERVSLKHRGGSKFARKQMIYNKYSDKSREAVQEMLQKSRELTRKVAVDADSSDDETSEQEEARDEIVDDSTTNPWMAAGTKLAKQCSYVRPKPIQNTEMKTLDSDEGQKEGRRGNKSRKRHAEDVMEVNIDSLFDKLEEENLKTIHQTKNEIAVESEDEEDIENGDVEESGESKRQDDDEMSTKQSPNECGIGMSLKRKQTLDDFDEPPSDVESDDGLLRQDGARLMKSTQEAQQQSKEAKAKRTTRNGDTISIDPKKFIELAGGGSGDVMLAEGEQLDDDQTQKLSIAQAFASDDVIQEFADEKRAIEERDKPKDVNLVLPGWGEWGGTGLQVPKRKRRRFVLKAPPAPPRKDTNLDNVIISEVKDTTITKHQVSNLPFPFTDPEQFERSIRQPIGKTWNPETAYKKLIKPKKVTRIGTIIPPMDKSQVNKNFKERHHLQPRQKRTK